MKMESGDSYVEGEGQKRGSCDRKEAPMTHRWAVKCPLLGYQAPEVVTHYPTWQAED